jgi:hypothetical protein
MLRWRPVEGKWNFLDLLCHLIDEELEDFRLKVTSILVDPNAALP